MVIRERHANRGATWTGKGYMQATEGATLEFVLDDIPLSTEYHLLIRYDTTGNRDWKEVGIELVRPSTEDPGGVCGNVIRQTGYMFTTLPAGQHFQLINPSFCLEKGQRYVLKLDFSRQGDGPGQGPPPAMLVDSVRTSVLSDHPPFVVHFNHFDFLGCSRS